MKIRLLFLNKKQKVKIGDERKIILSKCNKIAIVERDDMRVNQELHDTRCPNCKATKKENPNTIVDRITNVNGTGRISGGILDITGYITIETHAVNHCNNCGHEWHKFKTKSISETNVLRVCLDYLGAIINSPEKEKRFDWKLDAIKVFDDCSAETIYLFCKKEKKYLCSSTRNELKLSKLRRYYRSVFDRKNKRELEKI